MHASLAQIQVAYLVTYGEAMPGNLPFVDAGNAMFKFYGAKNMDRLLRQCEAAIAANPHPATYEHIADVVRGMRTISKG